MHDPATCAPRKARVGLKHKTSGAKPHLMPMNHHPGRLCTYLGYVCKFITFPNNIVVFLSYHNSQERVYILVQNVKNTPQCLASFLQFL